MIPSTALLVIDALNNRDQKLNMQKVMENIAVAEKRDEIKKEPNSLLVCFVCTGNTCRSPMAAALLNHMARLPEICSACDVNATIIKAVSRGLYATGEPIADLAVQALEEADIPSLPDNPYLEHVSKTIDDEVVEKCDLIIGLSDSHVLSLLSLYPAHARKITGMPHSISDPFGGDLDVYRECLAEIKKGIEIFFFSEETP